MADEMPVDEDVSGGAGDHGEGVLAVVGVAEADLVATGVASSAVHGAVVDAGGLTEWLVVGPGLGRGDPHVGGESAVK